MKDGIEVSFISEDDYKVYEKEVEHLSKKLQTVSGTAKIHAIKSGEMEGHILTRETSCHCRLDDPCDCEWIDSFTLHNAEVFHEKHGTDDPCKVKSFCIIQYSHSIYLGQIDEIIEEDNVVVNCMHKKGNVNNLSFVWPTKKDQAIVDKSEILLYVSEPVNVRRSMKLNNDDQRKFVDLLEGLM